MLIGPISHNLIGKFNYRSDLRIIILTPFILVRSISLLVSYLSSGMTLNGTSKLGILLFFEVVAAVLTQHLDAHTGFRDRKTVVPIYSSGMARYYVWLHIGSNNQTFRMVLDTGSPSTWVPSIHADPTVWRTQNRFDPSKSTTATITTQPFLRSYVGGQISGKVVIDDMMLGASKIVQFTFGSVTHWLNRQPVQYFDGVIGLAPTEPDLAMKCTFLDRLMLCSHRQCRKFALVFRKGPDRDGSLIFDDDIEVYFPGEIYYVAVVDLDRWLIKIQWMILGKFAFDLSAYKVELDTGSAVTMVPNDMLDNIHKMLEVTEYRRKIFMVNCSRLNQLPELKLLTPEVQLLVRASRYILEKSSESSRYCISPFVPQPVEAGKMLIVGNSVLRGFDMLFNADTRRVGFAPKEHESSAFRIT